MRVARHCLVLLEKLRGITPLADIDAVAAAGTGPAGPELRELADEANRLNETARIYVNLMAANVRRRLQTLTGEAGNGGYRAGVTAAYC